MRFFQRACCVCAFLASSVSHGVATPPFLPTLTVYYREVPLLVFRLVWCWSGVFCCVCADCADDSSAGSCASLALGCRCGSFFHNSAVFTLLLGSSVLAYGILALSLLFLGYAYGVAFFAPSAYPPLISILRLLTLWVLAAGPYLWWSLCVCGVLSEAAELCFLSLLLLGVG